MTTPRNPKPAPVLESILDDIKARSARAPWAGTAAGLARDLHDDYNAVVDEPMAWEPFYRIVRHTLKVFVERGILETTGSRTPLYSYKAGPGSGPWPTMTPKENPKR